MTASDFSDVFVSYRRKDVEFAKQIVASLQESGREVWIDWEDIAPGSTAFSDDIKRGLEGADAFLCILSPDYMESTYCVDLEMGYAIELKKKIIPVVLKKFDDYFDQLPDTVKGINWIYFTPHAGHENTYEESFPKIIQVLEQDLDHAREHKRLGLRALEWDANNRDISYVLDGKEIAEAEQWQQQSADKIPPPTQLHLEYIAASRKAAIGRARFLLTSAIVGLIITVVLAILALFSFRNARIAEATAVANLDRAVQAEGTAVANFEAAQAARATSEANLREAWQSQALFYGDLAHQESRSGRYQLATLLALRALTNYEEGILSENAYRVLHDALNQPYRERLYVHYPHGEFGRLGGDVFWLADDTQVLIIAETEITIWDVMTGEQQLNIPTEAAGDGILSADETQLIVLSRADGGTTRIYDLVAGEELFALVPPSNGASIQKASFSSDGSMIYATSGDAFQFFGDFTVWDAATGEAQQTITLDFDSPTAITDYSLNADETQVIFTSEFGGALQLFDVNSGQLIWDVTPEDEFGEFVHVRWSDDESQVIVGYNDDSGTRLEIYDAENGELSRTIDHLNFITEIMWNADQSQLLVVATDEIRLYDATNWETLMQVNHADSVGEVSWSADESQLLAWSIDDRVIIWDVATGTELQRIELDPSENILQADWFADEMAASIKTLESVTIWDVGTGMQLSEIPFGDIAVYTEWNDTETQLLANFRNDVRVYEQDYGDSIVNFPQGTTISGSQWSNDGTRFVLWNDTGTIAVWEDIADDPIWTFQIDDWIATVQFNSDATQLIAWNFSGRINILNAETGEIITQAQGSEDLIDVRWNVDETQILSISGSSAASFGAIAAWDIASGEQLYSIEHSASLNMAAWNTDETQVVGAFGSDFDAEFEVIIWDVETGEIINRMEVDTPALEAHWNSDETKVLIRTGLIQEGSNADLTEGGGLIWQLETGEMVSLPHEAQVNIIRWNSDETQVITASDDGRAIVWDATTGEQIHNLQHARWVRDAWWSADGSRIVTYDERLQIWDAETGDMLHSFHIGFYGSILVNPTGERLLLINEFNRAELIEIATGEVEFASVLETDFLLQDAQWHPDESLVMLSGFDQYAMWLLDYDELIKRAQTLIVRDFTIQERERYFLPEAE